MGCAEAELAQAENVLASALSREIDTARINDGASGAARWSPTREQRLLKAQAAWLAYRDAQCAARYLAPVARDLEEVNRVWCRTRLTKERVAELNSNFVVD